MVAGFEKRLYEESGQLKQRLKKLQDFAMSDAYDKLPTVERIDLQEQFEYMQKYYVVLARRIHRLKMRDKASA